MPGKSDCWTWACNRATGGLCPHLQKCGQRLGPLPWTAQVCRTTDEHRGVLAGVEPWRYIRCLRFAIRLETKILGRAD